MERCESQINEITRPRREMPSVPRINFELLLAPYLRRLCESRECARFKNIGGSVAGSRTRDVPGGRVFRVLEKIWAQGARAGDPLFEVFLSVEQPDRLDYAVN